MDNDLFSNIKIVDINENNIEKYDICIMKDKKNPGYQAKVNWIKKRFKEGLRIKRIIDASDNATSYIEYIPIENAWRAIKGENYLFVHCIYTYPKKNQNSGYMSLLIKECIKDAKIQSKNGVAVITTKKPFMADERVFEKNGFKIIENKSEYQLLVYELNQGKYPIINNFVQEQAKLKGLHLFYTDQCPALAKPVQEIQETCQEKGINLNIHYVKSAKEVQNSPFISGSFGIIYNNKILAERCISNTRFLNILKEHKF